MDKGSGEEGSSPRVEEQDLPCDAGFSNGAGAEALVLLDGWDGASARTVMEASAGEKKKTSASGLSVEGARSAGDRKRLSALSRASRPRVHRGRLVRVLAGRRDLRRGGFLDPWIAPSAPGSSRGSTGWTSCGRVLAFVEADREAAIDSFETRGLPGRPAGAERVEVKRVLSTGVALLFACGASRSFDAGVRSSDERDWDQAVAYYESAAREDPGNLEYRMALLRAREKASHAHRARAGELEAASDLAGAAEEIELALQYDPGNPYLRDELRELRRQIEEPVAAPEAASRERLFPGAPVLDPASDVPIDLSFAEETSLRTILETLAKLAGVNILFDEAYRDRTVSVELKGVTFREALELLLETHGLFYKVIDSTAVQVTPER